MRFRTRHSGKLQDPEYFYFRFFHPGLDVMGYWNSHTSVRQLWKVYCNRKLMQLSIN